MTVISNESDHDNVIPAKCIIAEISAYQSIPLQEHSVAKQPESLQVTRDSTIPKVQCKL